MICESLCDFAACLKLAKSSKMCFFHIVSNEFFLNFQKLVRMNMPVAEDGTVHFTTTLFALIRESLMIKTGPGIAKFNSIKSEAKPNKYTRKQASHEYYFLPGIIFVFLCCC